MKQQTVKTKRLVLSPLSDEALEALMNAQPDEDSRQPYREMLEGSRTHPENRLWYTAWSMAKKDAPDRPLGDLCFKGPQVKGGVEIGYGIQPEYEGQGYTTEAAQALIDWAFAQDDVYRVYAETEPNNRASQRILEKLGFSPCGEGEEGPRFQLDNESPSWLAVYMCIGLSVGLSIGSFTDHISIGMCLGLCFGCALGTALDAAARRRRQAVLDGEAEQE